MTHRLMQKSMPPLLGKDALARQEVPVANLDDIEVNISGAAAGPGKDLDLSFKDEFHFIMMTFIYKEPLDLLTKTLDNIKAMEGSQKFTVVVGFEE